MVSEGPHLFEFVEKPFIRLGNLLVLLVVAMCEGFAFVVTVIFLL